MKKQPLENCKKIRKSGIRYSSQKEIIEFYQPFSTGSYKDVGRSILENNIENLSIPTGKQTSNYFIQYNVELKI
jgi:hypothetical protein